MEHTFYRRLLSAVCAIALAFTAVCPAVAAAPEDALDFVPPEGKNVCIVSQTTFNYNKFKDLVEILRKKRYDNTVLNILNILNTICNATEERQREAKSIAGEIGRASCRERV